MRDADEDSKYSTTPRELAKNKKVLSRGLKPESRRIVELGRVAEALHGFLRMPVSSDC